MQIPLGVTGGPGSGKSTVLAVIREIGLATVSADEIVAELWGKDEFVAKFQEDFKWTEEIDKAKIRRRLGQDADFRLRLDTLFHREVVRQLIASKAVVAEVPLLFEACIQSLFRSTLAVACGQDEQLRRLTARLGTKEEALALIQTQLPEAVKVKLADLELRTDVQLSDVNTSVRTILAKAGILNVSKRRV